ncbi:MAG: VanZ family protein [Candidatus Cloacimonetes bacterium]|nr:VanZ family protein [Candidatus Cloacimonadota bacterium]
MIKKLFWLWLIVVIVINIIPIGNAANKSLNTNKLGRFRYDYLAHTAIFLCFGFIWIVGSIMRVQWFKTYPLLKFYSIVFVAAIALESIQYIIPWRSFNPMDLIANLLGAVLGLAVAVLMKFTLPGSELGSY